jgi:hypothetical protein
MELNKIKDIHSTKNIDYVATISSIRDPKSESITITFKSGHILRYNTKTKLFRFIDCEQLADVGIYEIVPAPLELSCYFRDLLNLE